MMTTINDIGTGEVGIIIIEMMKTWEQSRKNLK